MMTAERLDEGRILDNDTLPCHQPDGDRLDRPDQLERIDRLERLKRRSLRANARRLAHDLQALARRVAREAPCEHAELDAAVQALRRIWIDAGTPARGDEDSSPARKSRDEDF